MSKDAKICSVVTPVVLLLGWFLIQHERDISKFFHKSAVYQGEFSDGWKSKGKAYDGRLSGKVVR